MRLLWVIAVVLSGWGLGQDLIKDVSPMEVEAILKDMGVPFARKGDYRFRLELSGLEPVWLELDGCEKGRCSILALSAGFAKKVRLEELNEWNRGRRFSRAYLDKEGDPWVEWELDLAGGVTRETLRRFFRMFSQAVLPLFIEHIGFEP
ncbi:YbjN domain-containing protein [Thermus tenuipuniceus]|uniref:YbjN domain-containing protein n=1 Tax=Thermus tenuipuniceus TaxID=2078690 RepID=UPI000FF8AA3C|nr:YbjN domain-containing protein [Thermus tenuipuniceus]